MEKYLDKNGVKKLLTVIQQKIDEKMDAESVDDIIVELQSIIDYFQNGELEITGFTDKY